MPTSIATYSVRDDAEVTVTAVIGFSQPGGTAINLGVRRVAEGNETTRAVLGAGRDVRGRKCVVSSDAQCVNPASELTGVEVTISGGDGDKSVTQTQRAAPQEEVNYVTVISFT